MPITRSWQRERESRAHEAQIALVAQRTRSLNRVPCAQCGLPAAVYIECASAQVGTFRCRQCAVGVKEHFSEGGATVIVEPIRECSVDLFNELRFQGRINILIGDDESRRDRLARGEGVLTVEELALVRIAYDRGESAESVAERFLGERFFLAAAGAQ